MPDEVRFWERFLEQHGGSDAALYEARVDGDRPLEPLLAERLVARAGDRISILDVGSGPLPAVGYSLAGCKVDIVGVDKLAAEYTALLNRHGLVSHARLVAGEAEKLSELFAGTEFDAVYSSNALDHCHDPLTALRQMLDVCKPGGFVFLRHFINEGHRRAYRDLHQWNLCEQDGSLVIWSPAERHDLGKMFANDADLEMRTVLNERDQLMLIAVFAKHGK